MDAKTKSDLLKFIGTGLEQVGDLATWIQSPQRRFHRHEFFGVELARIKVQASGEIYALRDLGYGGLGLVGSDTWTAEGVARGECFDATLTVLDQTMPFKLQVRHVQSLHVGCEFADPTPAQQAFLKGFIQYMDAALQIRQADSESVFPTFRGREWLNLSGHRGSLRFHIRRATNRDGFEATLVFVMNGNHTYCTWHNGAVDIGYLNGDTPAGEDRLAILRQVVSLLVGIRQGASLPDFGPVIGRIVALIGHR